MSLLSTLGQKLAVVTLCLSLGACATYDRAKAPPAVAGPIAVKVSSDQLSGWSDLPLGAYKVPESDVVVTGHQRGNAGGLMFGVIGLAVTHAANSSSSAAGVSSTEKILRIRLAEQTRSEIEKAIAQQPQTGKLSMGSGTAQLDVSSALLLSYKTDTDVRPFTILKVALKSSDGRPLWETRYFASTGEAKPLEGANSWTANDGESLNATIAVSLQRAVKVMLDDVAHPYTRDDKRMTAVEAGFPYLRPRVQMLGYNLVEEEKYIAFVPKIGDAMVLSGVNVLDRSVTVYRPAKADDVVFKMLPDTPLAASKSASLPTTAATPTAQK